MPGGAAKGRSGTLERRRGPPRSGRPGPPRGRAGPPRRSRRGIPEREAGRNRSRCGVHGVPPRAPRARRTQCRRGRVNRPRQSLSRGRSSRDPRTWGAWVPRFHAAWVPASRPILVVAVGVRPLRELAARPLFGGRAGLGVTPPFPPEMRHGIELRGSRTLPAFGSLPARACGARYPCGKATNPPSGGWRRRFARSSTAGWSSMRT